MVAAAEQASLQEIVEVQLLLLVAVKVTVEQVSLLTAEAVQAVHQEATVEPANLLIVEAVQAALLEVEAIIELLALLAATEVQVQKALEVALEVVEAEAAAAEAQAKEADVTKQKKISVRQLLK